MPNTISWKWRSGRAIYTKKSKENTISSFPIHLSGRQKIVHGISRGKEHLKPHGELWIVVQKKQGRRARMKIGDAVSEMEIIAKEKGYWIIKAKHNGENKNGQV